MVRAVVGRLRDRVFGSASALRPGPWWSGVLEGAGRLAHRTRGGAECLRGPVGSRSRPVVEQSARWGRPARAPDPPWSRVLDGAGRLAPRTRRGAECLTGPAGSPSALRPGPCWCGGLDGANLFCAGPLRYPWQDRKSRGRKAWPCSEARLRAPLPHAKQVRPIEQLAPRGPSVQWSAPLSESGGRGGTGCSECPVVGLAGLARRAGFRGQVCAARLWLDGEGHRRAGQGA
ncbi:hypothetical protein JOD54_001676 [Actinokineospora baliensis]|nr:hypothetical protein [Actinokineospora baliensis]